MITAQTLPYEILIRFQENGSIAGAHLKTLRVIRENDQIITANETIATLELPQELAERLMALMAQKLPLAN